MSDALGPSTALLTDHYELTMLQAALASGTAERRCVFELFGRRLPEGRRYGVVAGVGRALDALERFRFDEPTLAVLAEVVDGATLERLARWRFTGDVWGYAEGEAYFPGSPLLVVEAPFAEAVLLETLLLSIYNHDSAIASAASRMTRAAGDRACIEMGSRRTHEEAAVAAARAAYVAGFAGSSNLAARQRHGVPTTGTSAHAFTLLHDSEADAFRAQVRSLGAGTTLLVDTYDVAEAVRLGVEAAGPDLGAVRLDSGDLGDLAHQVRAQLDALGARDTRILVTSDLDEHAIAALRSAPVDGYGATSWSPGRARTASWWGSRSAAAPRSRGRGGTGPGAGTTRTASRPRSWSGPAPLRRSPTVSATCWCRWCAEGRSSDGSRWTPRGSGTPARATRCRWRRGLSCAASRCCRRCASPRVGA